MRDSRPLAPFSHASLSLSVPVFACKRLFGHEYLQDIGGNPRIVLQLTAKSELDSPSRIRTNGLSVSLCLRFMPLFGRNFRQLAISAQQKTVIRPRGLRRWDAETKTRRQ